MLSTLAGIGASSAAMAQASAWSSVSRAMAYVRRWHSAAAIAAAAAAAAASTGRGIVAGPGKENASSAPGQASVRASAPQAVRARRQRCWRRCAWFPSTAWAISCARTNRPRSGSLLNHDGLTLIHASGDPLGVAPEQQWVSTRGSQVSSSRTDARDASSLPVRPSQTGTGGNRIGRPASAGHAATGSTNSGISSGPQRQAPHGWASSPRGVARRTSAPGIRRPVTAAASCASAAFAPAAAAWHQAGSTGPERSARSRPARESRARPRLPPGSTAAARGLSARDEVLAETGAGRDDQRRRRDDERCQADRSRRCAHVSSSRCSSVCTALLPPRPVTARSRRSVSAEGIGIPAACAGCSGRGAGVPCGGRPQRGAACPSLRFSGRPRGPGGRVSR